MIKSFFSLTLFCLACSFSSFAQEFQLINPESKPVHDKDISQLSAIEILEDSLVHFADSMYNTAMDEPRIEASYLFIRTFKQFIKTPQSYQHPCNKLKDKITILQTPDRKLKIYNWEVQRGPIEKRYYAVIQLQDGSFIPLVDVSEQIIRGAEDSVLSGTRWYGALYYQVIQQDIAGQPIYFIMGWNGSTMNSEKKIVEAFGFDSKGRGIFGAPVFNIIERGKRKQVNRFILEYQKGSKVSMRYDEDFKQIVFDHCESQIGDPAKKYTYSPDGTYDGLIWDGQSWKMNENVIQIDIRENGNAPVDKPIK